MDGVPQLLGDQRLVGALGDDPFLLRGWDAGLIEEALELGAAKHDLPQVDPVVEDGLNGGGVPVVGLAPVFALEVVGVVLVEVGLWIEDASLPEDLGHPYIAYAVGEHLEDVPHHVGGGRVYDEVVLVSGIFHDDCVDAPSLNVFDHPLEILARLLGGKKSRSFFRRKKSTQKVLRNGCF